MSDLSSSTQIFLLLVLLIICVLIIHLIIRKRFNYLPESVAVIYIGAIFGFLLKISSQWLNSSQEPQAPLTSVTTSSTLLNSNLFFMLFLPPIIFEQGYHLHKGNFFRNLGTISTFAIFGTTINALVTGAGLYALGAVNLSYKLPWRECFIIGSLNSAIDPVAILSIFQVLNVDQLLYMLVFGESILNDAVAIVLTNVIVESKRHLTSVDTTKIKTLSVIGLLASSNLTTMTPIKTTSSSAIQHHRVPSDLFGPVETPISRHRGDLPVFDDNDKYLEPDDGNDYIDPNPSDLTSRFGAEDNIPPKKKRDVQSKLQRALASSATAAAAASKNISIESKKISSSQIVASIKTLMQVSTRFSLMFYSSGFIGLIFGLISALLTKYLAFDKSSLSLEISLLLLTAYASYMFAELCHLSGIMSILVCGLTMSHYTHENLTNPGRQSITVLFRTIAFLAETCVFAYLGLGIFEYRHAFHLKLIIWTILLTLIGRAAHVFPLSFLMNCFRAKQHRITFSMQLIMWFAGLRGAISYALSVHVGQYYGEDEEELKRILVTTTLVTVLFTILVLGGLTMPVVKFLRRHSSSAQPQRSVEATDDMNLHTMMSKTIQFDDLLSNDENYMHQRRRQNGDDDTDQFEIHFANPNTMKGLEKINEYYIKPLLVRRQSSRREEVDIKQQDQKPLINNKRSNGSGTAKTSFINDNDEDDDDDDAEDDLLVVNQLRQENFHMKKIKPSSREKTRASLATLLNNDDE